MYNDDSGTLEYSSTHGFHSPTSSQQTISIPLLPQSASSLRGRPYAKKAPSKVWLAYTKSDEGPVCNYCGSIRKRKDSSTKTLWDHLDRKHYEVAMVLRRDSQYHMPSMESSISSLVPQAFCTEANLNDMPYLYSSLFETSRNDETAIKTESALEQCLTSNYGNSFETFTPPPVQPEEEEGKCSITEMIENGREETVGVSVMPSLVNQVDKKEEPISLVRWSLALTHLSTSSTFFGINVHGIRIDTGMDFASAEVLQVVDGRTLTTSRETVKLVGPINSESIRKSKAKHFEAGLPANWRNIIVEQYMDGSKVQ